MSMICLEILRVCLECLRNSFEKYSKKWKQVLKKVFKKQKIMYLKALESMGKYLKLSKHFQMTQISKKSF